jgi:sodium-dependent dicarboxylate transporter 2/3/5
LTAESEQRRSWVQVVGLVMGPAACAALISFARIPSLDPVAQRVLAVTAWVAIWWMTEPISANATALIPFVMFPMLGVMRALDAARAYQHDVIFLFLGGSFLALAVERAGLHRRMAGALMRVFGGRARGFLAGYLGAVTFTSFWMSNTATALLYLPSALSLGAAIAEANPGRPEARRLAIAILIATAVGSSVGGMATPIGTAPNMILVSRSASMLGAEISFASWLKVGLPLAIFLTTSLYLILVFVTCRIPRDLVIPLALAERRPWSPEEKRTGAVFAITVLAWITRADIPLFAGHRITGWSTWLEGAGVLPAGAADLVADGTVGILAALVLFLLPKGRGRGPILEADAFEKMPWGALVLLGSSFVLAQAFDLPRDPGPGGSSLSRWLADGLQGVGAMPLPVQLLVIALVVTFAGELASNTAMAALLIPIGFALAPRVGVPPLVYGFTICLAASCSFALPVATPPNTIVYATRKLPVRSLMATGLLLDLCGALAIPFLVDWLV